MSEEENKGDLPLVLYGLALVAIGFGAQLAIDFLAQTIKQMLLLVPITTALWTSGFFSIALSLKE